MTASSPRSLFTASSAALYAVCALSFLLAAYSLSLPHTPPQRATGADDRLAWLRAAKLLATTLEEEKAADTTEAPETSETPEAEEKKD